MAIAGAVINWLSTEKCWTDVLGNALFWCKARLLTAPPVLVGPGDVCCHHHDEPLRYLRVFFRVLIYHFGTISLIALRQIFPFLCRLLGSLWPCGFEVDDGACGAELHPPLLSGSQQQRSMERHSKVIPGIARRLVQLVFYANQEEDEKQIECYKYWDPHFELILC
ncbi:hypothetical protein KIN20_015108 [Parelaphostrongylus tenuis]|uniref:Uncharacterized protein n=1 Tax=Parelaphostrongylus tenuis TaxID=148309 RepID=A0AAD5MJ20_PARTN|nr:hypothetical protein KIN20_015108 [Parelaphostrongylus tenuis]